VVHQQRQQLSKNIANDENQTQYGDREEDVDQQFTANKSIDQFHFFVQRLAQLRFFFVPGYTSRFRESSIH
jgi:hypothetical protein